MKKLITLVGALMALGTGNAFGAMIGFSASLPTNTLPFTDNFTLSAFNSTLGTLTGVLVTLNFTDSATVSVFNGSGTTDFAFTNASATSTITINGPGGIVTSAPIQTSGVSGTAIHGTVTNFTTPTGSGTATANPLDLADYISNSPLLLNFSAVDTAASFAGTTGGPLFFGGSFSAGGTVNITYTYTAATTTTPEPATMTLFGSALLGIGFFARKRIKKS
jgi:hypothetical protein